MTREYWYHYQFYMGSPSGDLFAYGMPVIRRGQMTLDELDYASDVAFKALGVDPLRKKPEMFFTECVVEVRRVSDGEIVP